ncbi:MAG TPA: RES family NAD+ phosphorylase [Bryobacteraceae bacterium]|nr:RES family NAD+ phosphorylase [Bryobacteraceae bacterium]
MKRVFRILLREFTRSAYDGEGSYLFGGRWSSPGTRIVYASEYQSLAMLEYLAHLDPGQPMRDLVLACADIPEDVSRTAISVNQLPEGWNAPMAPEWLARYGDQFIANGASAILIVPSAIVPAECNYLLNPRHPDFRRIVLGQPQDFWLDPRLPGVSREN